MARRKKHQKQSIPAVPLKKKRAKRIVSNVKDPEITKAGGRSGMVCTTRKTPTISTPSTIRMSIYAIVIGITAGTSLGGRRKMRELEYVTAKRGLRKTHIRYPGARNDISVCRMADHVIPATRAEFDKNPCQICKRIEPNIRHILEVVDQLKADGLLDQAQLEVANTVMEGQPDGKGPTRYLCPVHKKFLGKNGCKYCNDLHRESLELARKENR